MSDHALLTDTGSTSTAEPPKPDDLFTSITTCLKDAGHPNPEGWLDSKFIKQAKELEGDAQFKMVSRHFRLALADVPANTQTARFGLMANDTDIDKSEYLNSFVTNVVPTLVEHKV